MARPSFTYALNLNVHVHALVLDGVDARNTFGALRFHPAAPLTTRDVDEVLATVEAYVRRVLARRGRTDAEGGDVGDSWQAEAPLLAGLATASVEGRATLGEARRVRTTALWHGAGVSERRASVHLRGGHHGR